MFKKIVISFSVIAFLAVAGGSFYWWQNQEDVREINETLPQGIKVVKSLFNNEYKVVNDIDGYEFKVPKAWKGLNTIEYMPEITEFGYTATSIDLEGAKGGSTVMVVNQFKIEDSNIDLKKWAEDFFEKIGLTGEFSEEKVGEFAVVKTTEEKHLVGMYVIFFKKDQILYRIINGSEDFIKEIILNGKW